MNKFVCFILICFLVLGFGLAARAQTSGGTGGTVPRAGGTSGTIPRAGGTGSWLELPNPLKAKNFAELITGIVDWMITLGSMVAVAMVIWSGFLFMTAAGNEYKLSNAKKSLLWSLVGLGILLMSKTFILLIQEIVTVSIVKMLI